MMNNQIREILSSNPVGSQVIRALERFISIDSHLLIINANERSMTHRIAIYLQEEFADYHVDCEYNRDDHEPKEIDLGTENLDGYDTNAVTVYPDIVVHERGNNDHNLLVIEFKKSSSSIGDSKDIAKLNAFKTSLNYQNSLFIELKVGSNPGVSRAMWV
ncbi:hypothetical protein WMQ58_22245 [Vibrio diabolicus]|uniref:hypothetical protein n=1 Tax=Gammaproteobacteria TaxID=1236 RepID=UPI0031F4A297